MTRQPALQGVTKNVEYMAEILRHASLNTYGPLSTKSSQFLNDHWPQIQQSTEALLCKQTVTIHSDAGGDMRLESNQDETIQISVYNANGYRTHFADTACTAYQFRHWIMMVGQQGQPKPATIPAQQQTTPYYGLGSGQPWVQQGPHHYYNNIPFPYNTNTNINNGPGYSQHNHYYYNQYQPQYQYSSYPTPITWQTSNPVNHCIGPYPYSTFLPLQANASQPATAAAQQHHYNQGYRHQLLSTITSSGTPNSVIPHMAQPGPSRLGRHTSSLRPHQPVRSEQNVAVAFQWALIKYKPSINPQYKGMKLAQFARFNKVRPNSLNSYVYADGTFTEQGLEQYKLKDPTGKKTAAALQSVGVKCTALTWEAFAPGTAAHQKRKS